MPTHRSNLLRHQSMIVVATWGRHWCSLHTCVFIRFILILFLMNIEVTSSLFQNVFFLSYSFFNECYVLTY